MITKYMRSRYGG